MATIKELLDALKNPNKKEKTLDNTTSTWQRIRNKDPFEELGMGSSELEKFLKEWIEENPYENMK